MMKILLLSDIPPCENLTAGLVLSALVRFVPKDSICFYIVSNPSVEIELNPEFANIPIKIKTKPNENWNFLPQRRSLRKLSRLATFTIETITEHYLVNSRISDAIEFGKSQGVDRVWAVLQGQTTIRMAEAVARGLEVPLHTHVWDPFSWWADAHALDRVTRKKVQSIFDKAVRASHFVATASEPMAELYSSKFGINTVPIIASHKLELAKSPQTTLYNDNGLLIGMAGQFYASAEWGCLLNMFDCAGWKIGDKKVKVVVMGPQKPPGIYSNSNVKYLGWKSQQDAAAILSLCDILYCPYPFDSKLKEVSSLSFPSKLVLYLAAGRPIVFHGPEYASPTRYIKERQCGMAVCSLLPTVLYNAFERLVKEEKSYITFSQNSQEAFKTDFTLKSMRECFSRFIGSDCLLKESGITQHYLDSNTEKFKEIERALLSRKCRSPLHTVRLLLIKSKLKVVNVKKWLRWNVISKVPPFKRFYVEIDYYAEEIKKLRKLVNIKTQEVKSNANGAIFISKNQLDYSDFSLINNCDESNFFIIKIVSANCNNMDYLVRKCLLIDEDFSMVFIDSKVAPDIDVLEKEFYKINKKVGLVFESKSEALSMLDDKKIEGFDYLIRKPINDTEC